MGEVNLEDGDYVLVDGMAWFTVGPFSVRVFLEESGELEIVVCPLGDEFDNDLGRMVLSAPKSMKVSPDQLPDKGYEHTCRTCGKVYLRRGRCGRGGARNVRQYTMGTKEKKRLKKGDNPDYDKWYKKADKELERRFYITLSDGTGLEYDDRWLLSAFGDGDSPKDFVTAFGEHYGLEGGRRVDLISREILAGLGLSVEELVSWSLRYFLGRSTIGAGSFALALVRVAQHISSPVLGLMAKDIRGWVKKGNSPTREFDLELWGEALEAIDRELKSREEGRKP